MTDPLELVLSLLPGYKRCGREYVAHCPAHDDSTPSLGVTTGDDGRVLLYCQKKCRTDDVVKALGLTMSDLFPKNGAGSVADAARHRTAREKASRKRETAPKPAESGCSAFEGMLVTDRYHYVDANDDLVFTVMRREDPKGVRKKFFTQHPARKYKLKNKKERKRAMDGVPRYLYRLPKVLRTVKTDFPVIVVEGEKDVKNLEALGFVATSGSGGACNWLPEYGESLRGGNIIVIPDNDESGRKHAQMMLDSIADKAKRIRVLNLPGLPEKGDASDWLAAGGTREQLIELAKACPDWEPGTGIWEGEEKPGNAAVEESAPEPAMDTHVAEPVSPAASPSPDNPVLVPATALDKDAVKSAIKAAIAVGTATAIYNPDVIHAIATLSEGERADIVQEICKKIKSVEKRPLKQKIAALLRENNSVNPHYEVPKGMVGVVLSPNKPSRDSCEEALAALVALNKPLRLFRRGGRLSRLRPTDQGTIKIEQLDDKGVAYELNNQIDFCYISKTDGTVKHTPATKNIVDYMCAHPDLPFPVIDGITQIPVLRTDGTILDMRGYDKTTRLYYHPPDGLVVPPIPDDPTEKERWEAAELLREVFCDMPYISEADRTHTLALLLSPILRQHTRTTPLALINAHQPSNGKSLIGDAISLVITGRNANNATAPIDAREWESFLGALLFSGEPLVFFDNVKHTINDASLEKVLTSEEVTSRVLGKSTALTVTNRITFALTGNNVQVGREIGRRSYIINLDAQMSNPEDRPPGGYRHPELRDWIEDNRGRIVWALFVIIRAWFAAGEPQYDLPHMGSFEKWVRLVGNILAHAGFGSFLANRKILRGDSDQESAQWEAFLSRWRELYGDESRSVADVANDLVASDRLGGAIPEDLDRCIKGYETNNVRIGKVFKKRDGCRFGPRQLRLMKGTVIRGQRMWTVLEDVELPPLQVGDTEGTEAAETAQSRDTEDRADQCSADTASDASGSISQSATEAVTHSLDLAQFPDEDDGDWKSY